MHALKAGALALTLALCLSGCGLLESAIEALPEEVLDRITDAIPHSPSKTEEAVASFIEAVDARDAEAARALFAPSALAEDTDFDETLEQLFDLYAGPADECWTDCPPSASKHLYYGRTTYHSNSGWVPVVSQGVNYYCYVVVTDIDEEEPDNLGINMLVFVTEKARCWPEFERPSEYGLSVVEDPPEDYLTCRIGDEPYIYTPVDRTLTREDILDFLAGSDDWDAFTTRFGAPNAVAEPDGGSWNRYYYELPDEDGEKRYAGVSVGDGVIDSVILRDGRSYYALGILWKPEEAGG